MFSAILLVALGTVSGHKCHGCAMVCSSACYGGCSAVVTCYAPACSCYKKHKCGLFKKLFAKKCHCACSSACSCSAPVCTGCSAPACCTPCDCVPSCASCAAPAPAEEAAPAPPAPEPEKKDSAGFRVERSPLVAVSFKLERAEFQDEPVVIFARN